MFVICLDKGPPCTCEYRKGYKGESFLVVPEKESGIKEYWGVLQSESDFPVIVKEREEPEYALKAS